MKNLIYRLLLIQAFALLVALAQPAPVSSIRVYTDPSGPVFLVDGQTYVGSQTFLWPQGSKHIVQFPLFTNQDGSVSSFQQSPDATARYNFGGWIDNNGLVPVASPTQTITADPKVTFIKAVIATQYRVAVRFTSGAPSTAPCSAPGDPAPDGTRVGLVYVASQCISSNTDLWLQAGAVPLAAYPYPGYVFNSWNIGGQTQPSFLTTLNLVGPITIAPVFMQAKRVQFVTDPPALQLLIDRTPTPTSNLAIDPGTGVIPQCQPSLRLPPNGPTGIPSLCYGEFDFLPGSQHSIAAVSPQSDNAGRYWVFDSFSNGMPQNAVYTANMNTASKDTVTAKFLKGVQTLFTTVPAGLKLQVDGKDSWQYYSFIWAAGSTHSLSAPAAQVDSKGRRWTFLNWSNGGPASQSLTVDGAKASYQWVANYTGLGQVKILTNPPGIKLQVDGVDCTSPCTVDREGGSQLAISAPASIPQSETSRLDFLGWSDGGASTRTYTFHASDATTIWANYGPSYRMLATSDPDNGVSLMMDPPSVDGFYPADSQIAVSAAAKPGFRFRRWGGDVSGVYPVAQVLMNTPRSVIALLDRVPYIAPAGIRSAAGPTADGSVAPGSIIFITGESLASSTMAGPRNPLAQTIAGVVVTVNDRILPLISVSPQQISAQVLSDLPDGDYTLKVTSAGHAAVNGTFTVSRNAPGLFSNTTDGQNFSLARHEDGTPIVPGSPARRGETVSIFGTGFGPYNQTVIDGFVIPDLAQYQLADPLEIAAGDQSIAPLWSGAAPGLVGTAVTRFKIDDSIPSATNLELTVRVNGKPSNKVLLPVE